jgi:thiosulfate reductase cytochrome b subunit
MDDVMADAATSAAANGFGARAARRHAAWVRALHWIVTASVLTLALSGFVILMAHPRLYWGDAGNDLTPPLFELPISRNYQHGGWDRPTPFFEATAGAVSASRTYDIFNENGWARSLHFLAAWWLVLPGVAYLLAGILGGHFRSHIWPRASELRARHLWQEVTDHLHMRIPPASGGPQYGLLQKIAYSTVAFVAAPLMALTGLAMSPAVTAAYPWLVRAFGGYQSARTIHFFTFVALLVFVVVHVAMVVKSGFVRQLRGMTVGE